MNLQSSEFRDRVVKGFESLVATGIISQDEAQFILAATFGRLQRTDDTITFRDVGDSMDVICVSGDGRTVTLIPPEKEGPTP